MGLVAWREAYCRGCEPWAGVLNVPFQLGTYPSGQASSLGCRYCLFYILVYAVALILTICLSATGV